MTDKKQYFIIALLAAILITTILQNKSLKKNLDSTNFQLQVLQNNFYSQINDVKDIPQRIKNILADNENRISNYEIKVNSINANEKSAELTVDLTLKNINNNSDVFILYKAADNGNWTEVKADKKGTLAYTTMLNLSIEDNYLIKFVEKGTDGAVFDLNTNPINKNLYSEFYENRTCSHSSGSSESKDELSFRFDLTNNTFGLNDFKIKSVVCELYYKDTLVYNQDITSLNLGNSDDIARYNIQVASGEIEPNEEMKPKGGFTPVDENIQKMHFVIKLDKAELAAKYQDLFDFKKVRNQSTSIAGAFNRKIIITYNSGETVTIDSNASAAIKKDN